MFPPPIQNLIEAFSKLPGLGPKTGERLVYYLITRPKEELQQFESALRGLHESILYCEICGLISEKNPCHICSDSQRDDRILCIVAHNHDQAIIEGTSEFKGKYHILGGRLNTLEGITPDKLNVAQLLKRIQQGKVEEIILAFDQDIEGEETTLYLKKTLSPFNLRITRLARGMPVGANIEYMDEITLSNSFKNREQI